MSEMIERVVNALKTLAESREHGFHGGPDSWAPYARAAIEAMREPTEAMVTAGWRACEDPNYAPAEAEARRVCVINFNAMIDAALVTHRTDS